MTTLLTKPSLPEHLPPADPIDTDETENEIENEDEVDQLDSDSEPEGIQGPNGLSASAKKPRSGRAVQRSPGTSLLSAQRLESILTADGLWPTFIHLRRLIANGFSSRCYRKLGDV
jgi:hypothetical protein